MNAVHRKSRSDGCLSQTLGQRTTLSWVRADRPRGHPRAKNLQVRFREDELDEVTAYAAEQGLPISTVVRLLVLKTIAAADDLRTALDRLETDLAAVRRKALSA